MESSPFGNFSKPVTTTISSSLFGSSAGSSSSTSVFGSKNIFGSTSTVSTAVPVSPGNSGGPFQSVATNNFGTQPLFSQVSQNIPISTSAPPLFGASLTSSSQPSNVFGSKGSASTDVGKASSTSLFHQGSSLFSGSASQGSTLTDAGKVSSISPFQQGSTLFSGSASSSGPGSLFKTANETSASQSSSLFQGGVGKSSTLFSGGVFPVPKTSLSSAKDEGEAPFPQESKLFSGATSSHNSSNTSKSLFSMSKESDTFSKKSSSLLFGKVPKPKEKPLPTGYGFPMVNTDNSSAPVPQSHITTQQPAGSAGQEQASVFKTKELSSLKPRSLFGGSTSDVGAAISPFSQASEPADNQPQPATTVGLFGKPVNDTRNQGSESNPGQSLFKQEQPRRSLSKWKRSRDVSSGSPDHRKRQDSENQDEDHNPTAIKRHRGGEHWRTGEPESTSTTPARLSNPRRSLEDLSSRTTLVVKDIPAHLNKGSILRRHFSRFGQIKRLASFPTKGSASVTFQTHEEAADAKSGGKQLERGGPLLQIFWRATSVGKTQENARTAKPQVSRERKSPSRGRSPGKLRETDRQVQDELASMAGTADIQEEIVPVAFVPRAPRESGKTSHDRVRQRSATPPPAAPAPSLPASGSDIDVIKGLLKVLWTTKAQDTSTKMTVLDARDKLMKLLRGRQQSDLASRAFAGSCADMCPEKERYDREDTRRLALYEVIPSTLTSLTGTKSEVDHSRAVKEYSRSSADQEEPLSHELRPLPVLVRTMNYLLSEIADQGGEGKWSEWYDFLWNRTRGIRKDITQQQLCDLQVAELMEKCARFHVLCSERLCEEDMMTFDHKINNENLTKCLQTLKELYTDLENKHKVFCPNEAEFRGYMVLMKLNEGDILREVQQMRPEIRDSAPILFAVEAYNALNSSNYVRFFRLIDKASFLNACALHRYFNQIRSQALRIIMKAHGALGSKRIMYPVSELMRLLRFESPEEVEDFCDHYCLMVEAQNVVLDAKVFLEPESSLPQRRSPRLVEAKCTVSVGETINGGMLSPLTQAPPFSSFDASGKFIISPDLQKALSSCGLKFQPSAADLVPSQRPQVPSVTAPQDQPSTAARGQSHLPDAAAMARERIAYSNEAIKSIGRSVILEVTDAEILGIAQGVMSVEKKRDSLIRAVVDDVSDLVVRDLARSLAQEAHREEERRLHEELVQQMREQRQRVFGQLCEDIVDDAVNDIVQDVALDQMRVVNSELRAQRLERVSRTYRDDLVSGLTLEMAQDVAQEVFETDVVAKRERLEETERCVVLMRCRKVFQFWRSAYLSSVKVKRAMLDFPCAPPSRQMGDQLQRLVPHRPNARIKDKSFFISDRARLFVSSPMEVFQQELQLTASLSMASVQQMLIGLRMWQPLDLVQTLGTQLYRVFTSWRDAGAVEPDCDSIHWKLCVSVPAKKMCKTEEQHKLTDWLRSKLCKDGDRDTLLEGTPGYKGEVLSLYHCKLGTPVAAGPTLRVCVRCFHGNWTDTSEVKVMKENIMKGCSAILFVSSPVEQLAEDEKLWQKDKQRLHQLLKQRTRVPGLPLVVLLPRGDPRSSVAVEEVGHQLGLDQLGQQGLLSTAHLAQPYLGQGVHTLECYSEWSEQLNNCLRFLASHVPAPPQLRVKPVSDFAEDAVVEMYKAPVYHDLRTRHRHQMLHQSPNTLVSLYNAVIEHIALVAASSTLSEVSWPSPEFDESASSVMGEPQSAWNSESQLSDVFELVTRLRLPVFRYCDLEAEDWDSVCQDVWTFVAAVTKKDSGSAKISLHHRVTELLGHTKRMFDQFCWLASEDGPCEPTYVNMAWTDLIDLCIHYKLVSLRTGHLRIEAERDDDDEEEEEYVETVVYYVEEELGDWEPPQSWLDAMRDTETAENGQIKPTVVEAAVKRDETILATSKQNVAVSEREKKDAPRKSGGENTSQSWQELKERFAQERSAMRRFEEGLSENLVDPLSASMAVNCDSASKSVRRKSPQDNTVPSLLKTTPLTRKATLGVTRPPNSVSRRLSPQFDSQGVGGRAGDVTEGEGEWRKEMTLTQGLSNLRDLMEEQQGADRLFELKLQRLMNPSPFL